jgi:PAS domain S-box-containing protein
MEPDKESKYSFILLLSGIVFAFCIVFWILSAAFSSYIGGRGSFVDMLFFNIPPDHLHYRVFAMLLFVVLGVVASLVYHAYYERGKRRTEQAIAERQRAEEELKLRAELLDNANDSIYVTDLEKNEVYCNKAHLLLHGYTENEAVKPQWSDFMTPGALSRIDETIRQAMEKGEVFFEDEHRRKDGSTMIMEAHGRIVEIGGRKLFFVVGRDITERRKMQESLIISDRLATLGEMGLGVSHELNNPLATVLGFSQLLLQDEDIKGRNHEDIEKIVSQAQRMADIIRNFVSFAGNQPTARIMVDLNHIIRTVLQLRDYELKAVNIEVETSLAEDLPQISGDQGQLQHAVMNIIMNAERAMRENNRGGRLVIRSMHDAEKITLAFSDSGPGMENEVLSHIFDPFFSTRGVGQGSGLGMSASYGIVREHGGRIFADSERGKGTTITMEFPLRQEQA